MSGFLEKLLAYLGFKPVAESKISLTEMDRVEIESKIETAEILDSPDGNVSQMALSEPKKVEVQFSCRERPSKAVGSTEEFFNQVRKKETLSRRIGRCFENPLAFLKGITVFEEYERAYANLVDANRPQVTFVSGGAGTGKSVFVKWLSTKLPEDSFIVLCPTGVSAINVRGQTIHSFCCFPPAVIDFSELLQRSHYSSPDKIKKIVKQIKYVIFDEISMVRCDLFDAVDQFFRHFSGNRNSGLIFGGKKILLVGDLMQLPPVAQKEDKIALKRLGYSEPFYCFNSKVWDEMITELIALTQNRRQDSVEFYGHLNNIRLGRNIQNAISFLNSSCPGSDTCFPVLTMTRENARAINEREMDCLPFSDHLFRGEIIGDFPEDCMPAPLVVRLKVGSRVMMLKNDPNSGFVNGTVGEILEIKRGQTLISEYVKIRLSDSGETVFVFHAVWERYQHRYCAKENNYSLQIVGRYVQIPVIPAWAMTVHKSQGLTISELVVDREDRGAFAPGQIYVALSRCSKIKGLFLRRELRHNDVICSQSAIGAYENLIAQQAMIRRPPRNS